jgi:hypothetical protein
MQDNEKIYPFDIIVKIEDISDFEKLLLFKILNLDNTVNGCYASDKYFANYFNKHLKSINRCISNLEQKKLIIKTHPENRRKIKVTLPKGNQPNGYHPSNPSVTTDQPNGYRPSNPSVDYSTKDITKEKTKERDTTLAFQFLKNNYSKDFKVKFIEKYHTSFKNNEDRRKFVDKFNNKMISDEVKFKPSILFARLDSFAISWFDNEKKYNKEEPKEEKRPYLFKFR